MQAYGRVFAQIYNMRWGGFVQQAGPRILDFYESTSLGRENRSLLDLCCGTGQLALIALERGYHVTGIDLSPYMLDHARRNAGRYLQTGRARFIQADAAHFALEERFGLVVSTYDALNHLDGLVALQSCFRNVYTVISEGGWFVFDLNTRLGLSQWNNISVDDGPEVMIVNRGFYDGQSDRAWARLSGFLRRQDGLYERFEETVFNWAFDMQAVRAALLEAGFGHIHMARITDLGRALDDPEAERRVFFVAGR